MSIRIFLASTLAILICLTGPARAAEGPGHYVDLKPFNLTTFVPPPPAAGSPAELDDVATVLREQSTHTPVKYEVFTFLRYAKSLGWAWKPESLSSATQTLFENLNEDVVAATKSVQRRYRRPRPAVMSPDVQWVGRSIVGASADALTGSYPSAHSAGAYAAAFVLAAMVPEKTQEIFVLADKLAWEPVLAGSHFPTDTTFAAQAAASVVVYAALQNPAFKSDFDKARSEIRAALKLP